jgi:hypothetical protein
LTELSEAEPLLVMYSPRRHRIVPLCRGSRVLIDEQGLAATYRECSDDELAALAAEMETLTDVARAALRAEIQRRGVSGAQLGKLHAKEVHREMRFDQKEKIRRKKTLFNILTRSGDLSDPRGWLWTGLIFLGFLLFNWLWSRFR